MIDYKGQLIGIEAQRNEINRACHELKHEMIRLNPREKFVKAEEPELAA